MKSQNVVLIATVLLVGMTTIGVMLSVLSAFSDTNDIRFAQVDARFEQVDRRFEQVDRRLDQIETRLERMEAGFGELRSAIAKLEGLVLGLHGMAPATASDPTADVPPQTAGQPAPA